MALYSTQGGRGIPAQNNMSCVPLLMSHIDPASRYIRINLLVDVVNLLGLYVGLVNFKGLFLSVNQFCAELKQVLPILGDRIARPTVEGGVVGHELQVCQILLCTDILYGR